MQVCQALGARTVTITHAEADLVSESSERSGEMGISPTPLPVNLINVSASGSRQNISFNGLSLQTDWVFEGGTADVEVRGRSA